MGVAGQKYSYGQLEQLWINAGGSTTLAPIMAAIAMAESSGGASSTNSNSNGSTDYGLWQINSSNGGSTASFDPARNAQQAVAIERSQGLGAWTTYSSGAYRQFLQSGVSPVAAGTPVGISPTGAQGTPVGFNPADPFGILSGIGKDIGDGIASGLYTIFKPLIRMVFFALESLVGVLVIGVAVFIIINKEESDKTNVTSNSDGSGKSPLALPSFKGAAKGGELASAEEAAEVAVVA